MLKFNVGKMSNYLTLIMIMMMMDVLEKIPGSDTALRTTLSITIQDFNGNKHFCIRYLKEYMKLRSALRTAYTPLLQMPGTSRAYIQSQCLGRFLAHQQLFQQLRYMLVNIVERLKPILRLQ